MVAKAAGLPPPPQVSMEEAQLTFSPERLSFLNESRRVSNERMLKHLGVVLKYGDVEAGIRASLDPARRDDGCARQFGWLFLLPSHFVTGSHCFQSGHARYSGSSKMPMPRWNARR